MEQFRVQPLSVMDVHSGGAHLTLTIGFIFSGVIGKARIESAVKVLAGKWPVLGARLRRPSPEVIEALIPDPEHAVLSTTFYVTPKRLRQVESLPTRTSAITTQKLSRNLELYFDNQQPTTEEIISPESPAFRLHVSCLADATTFTFTFPHVLMDASGLGSVMRGLISALEGKSLPEELAGDPWAKLLDTVQPRADLSLEGWTIYGPPEFLTSAETERIDRECDGPISQRTIYFPPAEIARLKREAMAELKALGQEIPFLSSGDVIVAWLYKHFYGDERYNSKRASRLIYILDARLRLPEIFTPDKVYLRNGYLINVTRKYSNSRICDMKLGEIARLVRELVSEGSKREAILHHLQWKHENAGASQSPAPAGERALFASNWLTFGFGDLNISNIIKPGTGTGEVLDTYWRMPNVPRCSGCITFRNQEGGVSAVFDWAESNWTSGSIGDYAIEKMAIKPKSGKEKKNPRIHSLFSWYRRLVTALN